MHKKYKIILVIFYIIKLITCSTLDLYKNARLGHRIVQTRYGRLHGLILPLDNFRFLRSVEAFLGVPYATPPTKSNRFSPTRAPAPWDGIRISDKYSPVCPQRLPNIQNETAALEKMPKGRLEYLKRLLPFLQNQSEDCLYLNVFSPIHAAASEKKLPVIVFLHGESFEWSSGNPYDGTVLASYGEVVVVTLNYRLGILGFLNANPSPQIRARVANYGLMDQMAALHWVQQNIIKFGGDPNMVTLAGHGTGAACINFLMTSPTMVPGLFHRAILMSGSAYSSWAIVEDPVIYAIKLAKEVNCSIPEDLIKNHEQIVDCLREVALEDLYNTDIQAPNFLTAFGPSVDGVVIRPGHSNSDTDEPMNRNVKRTPENLGRYDVLFGVVTGEAIWRFSAADIQNGFEGDRRDKIIRTYVRNAYSYHLNEIFYTIVNEYTDWERTSQHPINTRDTAVAALSDAQFVAPLIRTGDMLAPSISSFSSSNSGGIANGNGGGGSSPNGQQEKSGPKCYFYVFDYQTKDGDYPQRMGSVHGEDLPYFFGAPLVEGFSHFPSNYTKSEVALSEAVMIYWTNFARTGNPNEHHRQDSVLPASKERNRFRSITWEEYDSLHQKYLEIGMKPRIKNHFRAHQLSIWLRLIPELHRAGMEDVIARHNLFKNHDDMDLYDGPVKPDSLSRLTILEDVLRRRSGNISDLGGMLNGITTVEPSSFTTCIPLGGNYSAFAPTTIVNATTDTLSGFEAAGYAAYSTALSVTIAIGCSLLILNVLIFAGVYYQRDKTRLEVKSLQKQYQQRGMHQPVPFDPIKHAHYHLGHSQSANVIVDVENHESGTILLSSDVKSPHICSNSMQINTSGCGITTKMPLNESGGSNTGGGVGSGVGGGNIVGVGIGGGGGGGGVGGVGGGGVSGGGGGGSNIGSSYTNNSKIQREHIQMKSTQTFGRGSSGNSNSSDRNNSLAINTSVNSGGGGGSGGQNMNINSGTGNSGNIVSGNMNYNSGMMTLPKSGAMHHSTSMNYARGMSTGGGNNDCMTLPRNISSSHNNPSLTTEAQQNKLQPNGSVIGIHHIRAPRPPIRTASISSPPDHHHHSSNSNTTAAAIAALQQQQQQQQHHQQQHHSNSSNQQSKHHHQQQQNPSDAPHTIVQSLGMTTTSSNSHIQQQLPQAAMDEMRV